MNATAPGHRPMSRVGHSVFVVLDSALATTIHLSAKTIPKPSFEANAAFATDPSFVFGNTGISGWIRNNATKARLNPGITFSPFADKGDPKRCS